MPPVALPAARRMLRNAKFARLRSPAPPYYARTCVETADSRIRGALSGALPGRPGARLKQHLDSLLDERLRAGIFLRRDDAELPRHVGRNVGADVAAALAAGCRRSAPWSAALECGRVGVGGAHAAPLMVFERSRRSSVHAMNACTAATS